MSSDLQTVLDDLGVAATVVGKTESPSFIRHELTLGPGTLVNKVQRLEDHLSYVFGSTVRIYPVPNERLLGVEVAKDQPDMVTLGSVWSDQPNVITIGKSLEGPVHQRLDDLPHMIVAGATGSGKSVFLNSIITELVIKRSPDDLRLVLVDPKRVELSMYSALPHLEGSIAHTPDDATQVLDDVVSEVERRYQAMSDAKVRHANDLGLSKVLVIVDEFSDIMITSGQRVENSIIRIAQLARAANVHLILATQRPTVKVVTGLIKANMPTRLAFRVSSGTDSRVILDSKGAEGLLGKGDALFSPNGGDLVRVQSPFVSDQEIQRLIDHWTGKE